ncbi:MAG: hypothetical protein AAGC93_21280 [Cyanobacteria bacterium P01_F01_bin.53]
MKALDITAATAEQQALQLFGCLAEAYQTFRVANPETDLSGFRIRQSLNIRAMRVSFRLVVPLATTAEGTLRLVAAALPEMTDLGPLSFWGEPMTFENGQSLEF